MSCYLMPTEDSGFLFFIVSVLWSREGQPCLLMLQSVLYSRERFLSALDSSKKRRELSVEMNWLVVVDSHRIHKTLFCLPSFPPGKRIPDQHLGKGTLAECSVVERCTDIYT